MQKVTGSATQVRHKEAKMLVDKGGRKTWREHFDEILNAHHDRNAAIIGWQVHIRRVKKE